MTPGVIIYFIVLIIWSVVASYLILFKVIPRFSKKEKKVVAHHVPHPRQRVVHASSRQSYSTHNGFKSFAKGPELTIDDIVKALSGN